MYVCMHNKCLFKQTRVSEDCYELFQDEQKAIWGIVIQGYNLDALSCLNRVVIQIAFNSFKYIKTTFVSQILSRHVQLNT